MMQLVQTTVIGTHVTTIMVENLNPLAVPALVQMGINNMFEVVTTNRTYHLIADSDREMRQWIDILT